MARKSEKVLFRRKFAIKLSEDLHTPWLKKRVNASTLPRSTSTIIRELLKLKQNIEPPEQLETKNREICASYPCKFLRMTRKFFLSCSRAKCGEHHAKMRKKCFEINTYYILPYVS
ncbi:uncharacterized protein TNCV_4951301 [Trichonephila clavipes]|nr:uncharacterized protein TNCV_4951301 [Trichonephila clavipes]